MAAISNLCELCNVSAGRYTCPRCNIFYCTTTCYQSQPHSECSEGFFKDCVDEMLRSAEDDPRRRRNAEELLGRMNDLDGLDQQLLDSDDEADDVATLEERLKHVDLDDSDLVWSKLTDEEKRGYFEFLHGGDFSEVDMDGWEPFWVKKFQGKVVEMQELNDLKGRCPPILEIKDFKTISNKPPASCVQCNLINILAGYAFATRYFNGEHFKDAAEAISCVCNISLVFKAGHKFESFDEAVKSVIYEYKNLSWIETSEENEKLLITDLEDILEGPHVTENKFYILCCLSDLSRLFKSALKSKTRSSTEEFKKQSQSNEVQFETTGTVRLHAKKLDYYLSYVKDVLSNEFCTTIDFMSK